MKFVLLVFVLSVPFMLLGAGGAKLTHVIPINLPISSLMFIATFVAAVALTYHEAKSGGVKTLLTRIFDYKRAPRKIWYLPALLLMPLIMILSYLVQDIVGSSLPALGINVQTVLVAPVLFVAFFFAAFGEEIGWSGYAIDPMQARWGALGASLMLGAVWAIWHVIPWFEAGNSASWVMWQVVFTVATRVVIVWIYNNTGKSVLAATLYHAMINVTTFLYPIYGSYYNPEVTGLIVIVFAVAIALLWRSKTLASLKRLEKQRNIVNSTALNFLPKTGEL